MVQERKVPAQPRAEVLRFGKLCWSPSPPLHVFPLLPLTSSAQIPKTDSSLMTPTFSAP